MTTQRFPHNIAHSHDGAPLVARREALFALGTGLGSIALTGMLAADEKPRGNDANEATQRTPLAPRPGHMAAKAKSCIFLMMEGGPSHIDTFDPKPKLADLHLQEFVREGKEKSAMESGKRYYVQSPFAFRQVGQCGADMAENWEHLAHVADDVCFYRGCQVDSVNHPTALYQMNTGNRFGGDPAVGAWTTYGLGTHQSGFARVHRAARCGLSARWRRELEQRLSAGVLSRDARCAPRARRFSIYNLPTGITPEHQRANLDLMAKLNVAHQATASVARRTGRADGANYELAFRMQMQVPGILDIRQEDASDTRCVRCRPGTDRSLWPEMSAGAATRRTRRAVRATLRGHLGLTRLHCARSRQSLVTQVDQPIAALLADLRQRGLLDETLIVWCGEFGRSPDNGVRGGVAYGRDHNPKAMTIWLAGGGVKAGHTIGATDELGAEAVDCVHHVRDLHVTLLRLLGLDDNKLTFFHGGRFKQLSQFGGKVIEELIA